MAPEAGSLGARLRAGREKLGLTVLQTAERIHVDPKVVEYIEADNLVALGAPVYARGHIRHYAELVGESVAQLQEIYTNTAHASQPDLTQIAKVPPASGSSKLVAPALLVIAVFAIAGAVWWVSSLSAKKPAGSDVNVVGPVTPNGNSGTGPGSSAGAGAGGASQTAGEAGLQQPAADNVASGVAQSSRPVTAGGASDAVPTASPAPKAVQAPTAASAGATAMQTRSGATNPSGAPASDGHSNTASGVASVPSHTGPPGIHFAQAAASAAAAAASTVSTTSPRSGAKTSPSAPGANSGAAASNSPPPRNAHETQVTLHYSADSWTEVYDASGERLFYDVGAANSVRTVSGKAPLTVVLANASGVAVEVNGHSAPLSKLSRPDGTAQFSVSRAGRLSRVKPSANGG